MWSHNIYNGTSSPTWSKNIYSGTLDNTNTIISGATVDGVYSGYATITVPDTYSAVPIPSTYSTITNTTPSNTTLSIGGLTDTLVCATATQTLTNKTLTDPTNNIIARGLTYGSGEGYITTYTSKAPKPGQVLVATSATTAEWMDIKTIISPFSIIERMPYSVASKYTDDTLDLDKIKQEININDLAIEISI